jgi:ABC-type Zn uptake system ZnuABC Zn-binding protein ZnuA
MLAGCAPLEPSPRSGLRVVALETFLADIARAVAGSYVEVISLMPTGSDPHTYEPTPTDVRRVLECDLLISNGAGYDVSIVRQLTRTADQVPILEAALGIDLLAPSYRVQPIDGSQNSPEAQGDPHTWLDPINVVRYAENIRDELSRLDPAHAPQYAANAEAYRLDLVTLDAWIRSQVEALPPERRLLVTNHESLGYFAARYGFTVVGTLLPGLSSSTSPSARGLAQLVQAIRAAHVPAVFLETGSDTRLAEQVAQESGVRVVTMLFTESLSPLDGPAATYLDMMRYDTRTIVTALTDG